MKKIFLGAFSIFLFNSCSNEESNTTQNPTPNPTTEKIYFDGFNSSIGTNGLKWNELYTIELNGTNQSKLSNISSNGTIEKYAENPIIENSKIYFVSDKDGGNGEIFKMNLDGTNITRLTDNSGNNFSNLKSFSNATKLIAEKEKTVSLEKVGEIYVVNIDGTNQTKLTDYPTDGNCRNPSVNTQNNKILFACKINSTDYQIYSMNIDGSNKQILTTNNTLFKTNPSFSSDGSKIVFEGKVASTGNKHTEIFIMNSNGTNIVQLTNYSSNGTLNTSTGDPIFSNDGSKIYYVSDETGVSQIYSMNIDGTGKTKLTNTTEDKFNPVIK